jgi:hypothetical protein
MEHASADSMLFYGDVEGRHILQEMEPAFRTYVDDAMHQMAMMRDMGRGNCVLLLESFHAFQTYVGDRLTRLQHERMRRRVDRCNDGTVIIVESWGEFIPHHLLTEFLSFIGMPAEESVYGDFEEAPVNIDPATWSPGDESSWLASTFLEEHIGSIHAE